MRRQKLFSFFKKCFKSIQKSEFLDVIYARRKNQLNMMWLSRNTKVLETFPLKNGKLTPFLCDQVTQCLDSLSFSLFSPTSTKTSTPYEEKKNGSHTIARVHNIARVNFCTCTYVFLKQNGTEIDPVSNVRHLLEFYLFLIVATLFFLLNDFFIIVIYKCMNTTFCDKVTA